MPSLTLEGWGFHLRPLPLTYMASIDFSIWRLWLLSVGVLGRAEIHWFIELLAKTRSVSYLVGSTRVLALRILKLLLAQVV